MMKSKTLFSLSRSIFIIISFSILSYLICCTIDNHLSEGITFENHIVQPSESSLITVKQDKIKLNTFPSDLNQLITDIRTQLPTHIHYKTTTSVSICFILLKFYAFIIHIIC